MAQDLSCACSDPPQERYYLIYYYDNSIDW